MSCSGERPRAAARWPASISSTSPAALAFLALLLLARGPRAHQAPGPTRYYRVPRSAVPIDEERVAGSAAGCQLRLGSRDWSLAAVAVVVGRRVPVARRRRPTARGDSMKFDCRLRRTSPSVSESRATGPVWFTLEGANTLGHLARRDVQKLPKGADSVEPLGLAVDAGGHAWYTEAPKQRISRASADGTIASFALGDARGAARPACRRRRRRLCGSRSRAS